MKPPLRDFDRWVLVTLHLRPSGLALDYLDETGRSERASRQALWLRNPAAEWGAPAHPQFADLRWAIHGLLMPRDFDALVRQGYIPFTREREHRSPAGHTHDLKVPWLLPVFVKPPPGLEALPWESWLEQAVFKPLGLDERCVLVRHLNTRSPTETPALPWVLLDHRDAALSSVPALRNLPWFAGQPAVQSHGLWLHDLQSMAEARAGDTLRPHLVIEGSQPLRARRRLALDALRLRVSMLASGSPLQPPHGSVPLLRLAPWGGPPPVAAAGMDVAHDPVVSIVYGLVHDFALHELLWILRRSHPQWQVELWASPQANQAMRLSQAMRSLRDDIVSGVQAVRPGGAPLRPRARIELANQLGNNFTRESTGFTDMARALAGPDELPTTDNPWLGVHFTPEPSPPRRVEMTLDRYDENGVAEPLDPAARRQPLRCGWRYRLAVQIGQPNHWFSAMASPPPPIDDLLPPLRDEAAYALEVSVFAKTFRLRSIATQALGLPRTGPSNAVFFELSAPAEPGLADLRIAIYHRNNLLQSFRLEAWVADGNPFSDPLPSPLPAAWPPVAIHLQMSGVSQFDQGVQVQQRALSVALNDDLRPGGHTLMIKGTGTQIETHPAEAEMALLNTQFQSLLKAADQGATFEATVRDLADLGSKLWLLLAGQANADDDALRRLRDGDRLTAQFVRHGSHWSLPWQTLYDLKLPRGADFRNPQVCLATDPVQRQPGANEYGCRHHPGQPVLCIEGFWCVRHQIELISEDLKAGDETGDEPAPRERETRVQAPQPHPLLALGLSAAQAEASALDAEWQTSWGTRLHHVVASDAPVDASFWRDDRRPALLVLISHMWPAQPADGLPRRLYACVDTIEAHEISVDGLLRTRAQQGRPWLAPTRPLVLLLACGSGRQQNLGELVDFTDAFLHTGAAAVVGTEWDVLATDAVRFARHVAQQALQDRQPLGELMRRFHQQEFSARRGLSLIFTAYGSADLLIEEVQAP